MLFIIFSIHCKGYLLSSVLFLRLRPFYLLESLILKNYVVYKKFFDVFKIFDEVFEKTIRTFRKEIMSLNLFLALYMIDYFHGF